MDILKIFNLYDNEIKINIIGTVENPLFQANQIGKLLGLKNIRSTIENFDKDEKMVVDSIYSAGGKQKTTFLTEIGLYRLLGMSRKEEARIFQKWICNVVKELRLNGKYELDSQKEDDKRMNDRNVELERHRTLLSSFDKKHIIYICILDNHKNIENTDCSIYKIGWSNNFKRRLYELEKAYGPVTLLYIFEAENNIEFEKFLFNHKKISCNRYKKNIIKNHTTRELFLLSPDNLYDLLEIIKNNIKNYQKISKDEYIKLKQIELENNKVKLENNKIKMEIFKLQYNDDTKSEITEFSETQDEEIENLEEFTPKIKLEYEWKEGDTLYDVRKRDNSKSPYIQKYDPNTFELIETFDSLIDLTRINDNISRSGLKNAVKSNTIYNGFRWLLIDKLQPNIKYNLEPTNNIIIQKHNELIAMIDIDKKNIVEVFPSQKEASIARKFTNGASISAALKRGTISSGHYWLKYDECSNELKETYNKPLPDKIKTNNSKKVEILHKTTKEIIKIFNSIDDVLKEFQMSRLTLNKAIYNNEPYKGFYFRIKL
jgi:prophage antirepressor-like protein